MKNKQFSPETLAIHSGYQPDKNTGAVAQNIVLSTTFERGEQGELVAGRDVYSRASNPNRRVLEQKLAMLEGGVEAVAFASGQAATLSVFHALGTNSHVILPDDIYYNTRVIIENLYKNWGLSFSAVDMSDLSNIKKAIQKNTKLIWIETPSNPSLKIADIQAIVKIAKAKNIITACDNTWATPYFSQPFSLGVDIIMHSTTKYLGGHSDIIGGCVIFSQDSPFYQKIRDFQVIGGAIPSPFDCWLLNRSLATFYARMPIHGKNALTLAQYLEKHPAIEQVNYPGLVSNPYHRIAKKQMKGIEGKPCFGGMMSILVKGGEKEAMAIASKLKIFTHATSLGGVESLIEHRKSVEGVHSESPENLLRISVGIENIDDLIQDFEQALRIV